MLSYYLRLLNPTLHNGAEVVAKVPFIVDQNEFIDDIVKTNVRITKLDWDTHETSWDFQTNPLISLRQSFIKDEGFRVATVYNEEDVRFDVEKERETVIKMQFANDLKTLVSMFKQEWEEHFMHLHHNEEELNRQFIEIYGLQDELTPDVPLDEITILQQGEISIEDNQIVWHNDVLIKQLISYVIGCWMGRYRLDKPGLWIAHPNATDDEVCTYDYHGRQFEIDDDGIIPLLSQYSNFTDNGYKRVEDFLRIAFGEDTLTENINFVQEALGMTIERYMQKEFWKYHKKMYQNRPIYWLFSSKKGAFQCLAYMHRMNAYTVEQIRSKYLLPHIEWLKNRIAEMESRAASLKTNERRIKEQMQKDLQECLEYHDSLHLVADQQISFDLDDGVVKNYALYGNVLQKLK